MLEKKQEKSPQKSVKKVSRRVSIIPVEGQKIPTPKQKFKDIGINFDTIQLRDHLEKKKAQAENLLSPDYAK